MSSLHSPRLLFRLPNCKRCWDWLDEAACALLSSFTLALLNLCSSGILFENLKLLASRDFCASNLSLSKEHCYNFMLDTERLCMFLGVFELMLRDFSSERPERIDAFSTIFTSSTFTISFTFFTNLSI